MKACSKTKDLITEAEAQGWRVERTRNGHITFLSPDGQHRIVCGGTESDHRAVRNTRARIRRAGLVLVH